MTPRKAPAPPPPLTTKEEEQQAAALASLFEPPPQDVRELSGTPEFLEELDALDPITRARFGFRFSVYDVSRGPAAYLEDSDWGTTVPTEAAIARKYGPGVYRVRPMQRRGKGGGGGNAAEITIHIGAPRSSVDGAPAPASGFGNDRLVTRLLDIVENRTELALQARAQIPDEPPAWVEGIVNAIGTGQKPDGIPEWAGRLIERFAGKLIDGDDAPAGPKPAEEQAA